MSNRLRDAITIRVLTNLPAIEQAAGANIRVRVLPPSSSRASLAKALLTTWVKPAVVFINSDHTTVLHCCLWLRLVARSRCKLVCADLNFNKPSSTIRSRLLVWLKRTLLRRVDVFLLLQKEFAGYQRYYGIDARRAAYLPWKVNHLSLIQTLQPSDDGYVFAGGVTHRDWTTFGKAVSGLPIRVIVSIPNDEALRRAGQTALLPADGTFGDNVEVHRHGPDPLEWLRLAAHARMVVMPISGESLNPSGISTALSILALGKPLVISEGPTTVGILDSGRALVVPSSDPTALRAAILDLNGDEKRRERLVRAGSRYAAECGGDLQLYSNMLQAIEAAAIGRDPGSIRLSPE